MGICQVQPLQNYHKTVLPQRSFNEINDSPTVSEPLPTRLLFVINKTNKNVEVRKSTYTYLQQDKQQSLRKSSSQQTTIFGDNTLITQIFYQRQQLIIQKIGQRPTKTKIDSKIFNSQFMNMLLKANWDRLTHLRINNNKIGNIGCKYLSKARMNSLQKLGLIQNNIESAGVMHLSKMCLRNLKQLYLGSNKISLGMSYLIKIPMPKIEYINLQNNSILPFEMEIILISHHNKLSLIDLTWNKLQNVKEKKRKQALFLKKYKTKDSQGIIYSDILTC